MEFSHAQGITQIPHNRHLVLIILRKRWQVKFTELEHPSSKGFHPLTSPRVSVQGCADRGYPVKGGVGLQPSLFCWAGCEPWLKAASVQWKGCIFQTHMQGYIFQIYIFSPRGYVQPEEMTSCKLDKCVCWVLGKW